MSTTVAFVGLGRMGWPMAGRLAKVARVLVWARRADVAASHAKTFGSEVAPSLPALAEADVLFTCLPTSEDVAQVLDAVPLRGGTIVVDCTSGDPQLSKQLADDLAAHRGCWFVDAPVSGGVSGAEAGTLTVMLGGDEAAQVTVRPLLAAFASNIVSAGSTPGAGHALKGINNLLNFTHLMAATEGLLALAKWGVSPDVALAAINQSSGRSMATEKRLPEHVLTGKFSHGFALGLMAKDCRIGGNVLLSGLPSAKVLAAGLSSAEKCLAAVGPTVDYTAAVQALEADAQVQLRSKSEP